MDKRRRSCRWSRTQGVFFVFKRLLRLRSHGERLTLDRNLGGSPDFFLLARVCDDEEVVHCAHI